MAGDAPTSVRPCKQAWPLDEALDFIGRDAGALPDPDFTAWLRGRYNRRRPLGRREVVQMFNMG